MALILCTGAVPHSNFYVLRVVFADDLLRINAFNLVVVLYLPRHFIVNSPPCCVSTCSKDFINRV